MASLRANGLGSYWVAAKQGRHVTWDTLYNAVNEKPVMK